jgi:serine/threonine protein phosphatase 1
MPPVTESTMSQASHTLRSYAIGDIHGQIGLLRHAHDLIAADRTQTGDEMAPVIHLGDLVDRGPDSRGVTEFLMAGVAAGHPWQSIKGNHDRMFTGFLDDLHHHDPRLFKELSWLHPRLGGATTLASYGVANAADRPLVPVHADAVKAVPAKHRQFLQSRPTWILRGDVLFVHAGIRPGVDLHDQTEDDLVWIRSPFLEDRRDHGVLVVHGHTALDEPAHLGNRVNLDSGAAYGGPLTAAVFEGCDVWVLSDKGRLPLLPSN